MRAPVALARATFPAPVLEVLRRLDAAGHRSWLVGGAVRDLLLHRRRAATDFDVATPATPRQVMALFPKVIPTGVAHGTVTVLVDDEKVEVTTFRGEGAYVDGRRPESVTFLTELEADLARRDFTMNAMAFDPIGGDFRDPFGGRADMRRRTVRAVGDPAARFGEDGLRPLRAVRLAAQLGYELDPRTRRAIPGVHDVVRKVSVERVAEELSRLVVARHAGRGVELLRRTGLLEIALPELAALPPRRVAHAAAVLDAAPPAPALRFAALLHPLGPDQAERVLLALRLPRRLAEDVGALLRAHACLVSVPRSPPPRTPAEIRRWLARVDPARAPDVLSLAAAEARAAPPGRRARAGAEVKELKARVDAALAASPALSTQALALDGRAVMTLLGAGPGPHVGEALRHLLDRVLEDPGANTPERLEDALRRWWELRSGRL
jgi:tRNA nucleotidyltransferase (CCA-adding enzyme)